MDIVREYHYKYQNKYALRTVALIESVYGSQKLFDLNFFEFLDLLEKGKLNYWLSRGVSDSRESNVYLNSFSKNFEVNVKIAAILIESNFINYCNIFNQNTKHQQVDDVLVLEFGNHKITMIVYENKLRLHSIHNKHKNRTKLFSNYSFKTSDEALHYFNNIEEYSEFNTEVLEMINFN